MARLTTPSCAAMEFAHPGNEALVLSVGDNSAVVYAAYVPEIEELFLINPLVCINMQYFQDLLRRGFA